MPVECSVEIQSINQEQFHALDRTLMGIAFELQNSVGKLCDEQIYQNELGHRCIEAGIRSQREVEVRVMHGTFAKSYFLDLLVEQGAIYELKAVKALAQAHQSQLINYLLLTGCHHGKLVNFRSKSVESSFVSTQLTRDNRMRYHLSDHDWHHDPDSDRLRNTFTDLLADWGAFLDFTLYREALLHLLNGPDSGLLPVAIRFHERSAGIQNMCLLNPETAWHLSAIKTSLQTHETQIRRLLSYTELKAIHWINLNQSEVILKSLIK
jgi:GxxExxY protein